MFQAHLAFSLPLTWNQTFFQEVLILFNRGWYLQTDLASSLGKYQMTEDGRAWRPQGPRNGRPWPWSSQGQGRGQGVDPCHQSGLRGQGYDDKVAEGDLSLLPVHQGV